MSQPDAIIRIKNLRLRTFIGIKEEEIANRQDVVVNVAIHYPADKARDSEDINDALGNDSNLLIVFYVQIMPDDFVMQLHRF
ncbi:dihydroneopterin triphosphate epimerase [Klebsiella pneumoniae]|nr:dihydroneopterin triphosphate epimerase [Klebsiella pneumoniae]